MPFKHLTPELLREAAMYLSPDEGWGDLGESPFMCCAVGSAVGWTSEGREAREGFERLLDRHEISLSGMLGNPYGVDILAMSVQARQALRFTFMHLLACDLESRR